LTGQQQANAETQVWYLFELSWESECAAHTDYHFQVWPGFWWAELLRGLGQALIRKDPGTVDTAGVEGGVATTANERQTGTAMPVYKPSSSVLKTAFINSKR